jgi:hypothetical protein
MKLLLLILLEYIVLPLGAIICSLLLKRDAGRKSHSTEEFIDDLTIDVKVIAALGFSLFAISCFLHNEHNSSVMDTFSWIGAIGTLVIYIFIQHTIRKEYLFINMSSELTLFGIKNALNQAASWLVVVLVSYVFLGIVFLELEMIHWNLQLIALDLPYYLMFLVTVILSAIIFVRIFFWCLNLLCKSFLPDTPGFSSTYSKAFANEELSSDVALNTAIKQYGITLATLKNNDPRAIPVALRLHKTFEKKYTNCGNTDFLNAAENAIDKAISLLKNPKINQDNDYYNDARLEKVDFLKRHNRHKEAADLLNEIDNQGSGS